MGESVVNAYTVAAIVMYRHPFQIQMAWHQDLRWKLTRGTHAAASIVCNFNFLKVHTVTAPVADGAVADPDRVRMQLRTRLINHLHDAPPGTGHTDKTETHQVHSNIVSGYHDTVLIRLARDVTCKIIRTWLTDEVQRICIPAKRLHWYSRLDLIERLHRRPRRCARLQLSCVAAERECHQSS